MPLDVRALGRLLAVGLSYCLCQGAPRAELDKTPFPCKDKYDEADISQWVTTHLAGKQEGYGTPHLLLMLGGSGAGKGTFIKRWQDVEAASPPAEGGRHALKDFVFHGLDEYLPYVPEYRKTVEDANGVYKDAADACYGGAAIPAAKLAGAEITKRKMDLIYEETGKSLDRIKKRVLPPFVEAGYRITVVLIHNNANTAIKRSAGRFQKTGRYAADDYIRGTFKNNLETYNELKEMESIQEFVYCDNGGEKMTCWADGHDARLGLVPTELLAAGTPQFRQAVDEL